MAHRRDFYLYKRHKKRGDYWYVCFLDRETGKQQSAKSIDCLKEKLGIMDFKAITRKEDAAIVASKALEQGLFNSKESGVLFSSWCKDFWDYDNSEYITLKNRLEKNAIGREYAYNMKKNFEKNVEPLLPKGLKLVNVTSSILDRVVKALYKSEKQNSTINIIIYSFSLPLKEARRLGYIASNPADSILKSCGSKNERGILSLDEVKRLREELEREKDNLFPSLYYGILLGLITGMRISEIRALNASYIMPSDIEGQSKVIIRHSVAYISGLKSTKSKYERSVLISSTLANELKSNASSFGVLLPSPQSSKEYISTPSLRNGFYTLLSQIGISEEERKERNITFHSLRHTFSTLGRDYNISQEDRMAVLGHKSKEINDRYTHLSDEALKHVSVLTNSIYEDKL